MTFRYACLLLLQFTLSYYVTEAQYQIQGLTYMPQNTNFKYLQQPLTSILSLSAPVRETIGNVASVVQRTPPNFIERKTKRQQMAEMLKQSALESLMVASNACKCCQLDKGMPKPMAPGDSPSRLVKYKYM